MQSRSINGAYHSRVIAATWPWQERERALSSPAQPAPWKKALLQAAIGTAAGFGLFFWHKPALACIAWAIAGITLVSGLFIPAVFHALDRAGRTLGRGAAALITWTLLVPFFYIVFTFGRLVLILKRRDPLDRRFPSGLASTWLARKPVKDAGDYQRQY